MEINKVLNNFAEKIKNEHSLIKNNFLLLYNEQRKEFITFMITKIKEIGESIETFDSLKEHFINAAYEWANTGNRYTMYNSYFKDYMISDFYERTFKLMDMGEDYGEVAYNYMNLSQTYRRELIEQILTSLNASVEKDFLSIAKIPILIMLEKRAELIDEANENLKLIWESIMSSKICENIHQRIIDVNKASLEYVDDGMDRLFILINGADKILSLCEEINKDKLGNNDFFKLNSMKKLLEIRDICLEVGEKLIDFNEKNASTLEGYKKEFEIYASEKKYEMTEEINEVKLSYAKEALNIAENEVNIVKNIMKELKKSYKLSCKQFKKGLEITDEYEISKYCDEEKFYDSIVKNSKLGLKQYISLYNEKEVSKKTSEIMQERFGGICESEIKKIESNYSNELEKKSNEILIKTSFFGVEYEKYWDILKENLCSILDVLNDIFEENEDLPVDFQKKEIIEELIDYIQKGFANSIEQAIAVYKYNKNKSD